MVAQAYSKPKRSLFWPQTTLLGLLACALWSCSDTSESEPKEKENQESTQNSEDDEVVEPNTARFVCGPLDPLEVDQNPGPPLPPRECTQPAQKAAMECPNVGRIAFVYDDDVGNPGKAWKKLLGEWKIRVGCGGDTPPLEKNSPELCGRIQEVGAPQDIANKIVGGRYLDQGGGQMFACRQRSPAKKKNLRFSGSGRSIYDYTPAQKAVERLCKLLTQEGERGLDIAFLAFDGVPDQEDGGTIVTNEFASSVAQCASQGIHVGVIAKPEQYQYVYVFGKSKFATFMLGALKGLASLHFEGAHVLDLTPMRMAAPGILRKTAAIELKRLLLSGDYVAPANRPDEKTNGVVTQIGVESWLLGDVEKERAAWALTWHNTRKPFNTLAPIGTRLGKPIVHLNVPLKAIDTNALAGSEAKPFAYDGTVDIEVWPQTASCQSPMPAVGGAQILLQSAVIYNANGMQRLELGLRKTPPGIKRWGLDDGEEKSELHVPRTESFLAAMDESKPLLAFVLMSPGLTQDPCAVELERAVDDAHRWGASVQTDNKLLSKAPNLKKVCQTSSLMPLVESFERTSYKSFKSLPPNRRRAGIANDRRAGMGALADVIKLISGRLSSTSPSTPRAMVDLGGGCVLRALQVRP